MRRVGEVAVLGRRRVPPPPPPVLAEEVEQPRPGKLNNNKRILNKCSISSHSVILSNIGCI